jgi:hypothetical protein
MQLPEETLARAAAGDLDALAELDARGFLAGAGETPAEYVARLRQFASRSEQLDRDLAAQGEVTLEDVTVQAAARIDPALYQEAGDITERLFRFRIDWVPGFYIDPRCAWLFGGCAFSFFPEFFALFIIRRSFATQARWFLYNRRELLAHELTHVARFALFHEQFEERFAYLTAESAFRRASGGIFRAPRDSFVLLGSSLLLLLAQLLQLSLLPALPMWLFWLGVLAAVAWLAARHLHAGRLFRRAAQALAPAFPAAPVTALLCRCTRDEILALAALRAEADAAAWVEARAATDWRWRLLRHRFGPATELTPAPDHGTAGH